MTPDSWSILFRASAAPGPGCSWPHHDQVSRHFHDFALTKMAPTTSCPLVVFFSAVLNSWISSLTCASYAGLREHLYQHRGSADAEPPHAARRDGQGPRAEEGKHISISSGAERHNLTSHIAVRGGDGQLLRSLPPVSERQGQGQRGVGGCGA